MKYILKLEKEKLRFKVEREAIIIVVEEKENLKSNNEESMKMVKLVLIRR